MRVLLGIILGAALTVMGAFVYDSATAPAAMTMASTATEQRPMVNWDVVTSNWQGLSSGVRNTWNKLASR